MPNADRPPNPNPGIQSASARLIELATEIVGKVTDPVERARLIQHWVFEKLAKNAAKDSDSALTILENSAGDCTEHARLFVALARAAGLPAREIGGLLYVNYGERPLFAWHAWAEIHDGHQWVSVDPAWDQVWVDATHIRFSTGVDDLAWANVVGRLEFEVVEFAKRK